MKRATAKSKRATCHGRETREALIKAAKELFADLGFDGVTVSAICKRAGLSGTQVHYHFRDKVHLYRTLLTLVGDGEIERLAQLLIPPSTTMEFRLRLELFASEYLGWRVKDDLTFKIANSEYVRGMPVARDIIESKFANLGRVLGAYLASAKAAGWITAEFDAEAASVSLFTQVNTVSAEAIADETNRNQIATELVKNLVLQLNANSKVTPEDRHASSK